MLETKGREVLAAVFGQAAAEHEAKAAESKLTADRKLAEVEARRAGFQAFVVFQATRGIRITVDLLDKVADLVGTGAEKLTGMFGEKKGE